MKHIFLALTLVFTLFFTGCATNQANVDLNTLSKIKTSEVKVDKKEELIYYGDTDKLVTGKLIIEKENANFYVVNGLIKKVTFDKRGTYFETYYDNKNIMNMYVKTPRVDAHINFLKNKLQNMKLDLQGERKIKADVGFDKSEKINFLDSYSEKENLRVTYKGDKINIFDHKSNKLLKSLNKDDRNFHNILNRFAQNSAKITRLSKIVQYKNMLTVLPKK